ncbi:MAG TPA: tetratricopeptide repeat protein [Woeseiaceae bacterium]|nr:tetratricopeptide repeat protein [Woeseiaceae bacterium]
MRASVPVLIAPFLALCTSPALPDPVHEHPAGDPELLGAVEFQTSCVPEVQEPFARATAMLHSFWYEAARDAYQAVATGDPQCAIAWWGVAMSYWQPLWEPQGPNPDALRDGLEAVRAARAVGGGSPVERDFIAAIATFYENAGTVGHRDRVLAYEKAMEAVHAAHPEQTEARVFYALSLLGSAASLPPDKSYRRQRKAGELLMPVFESRPEHPGAAHYIIHAYDYPALAQRGLEAARRYAAIAPDSPHAQHMPSHIFTRLGLWDDSIRSNRKVIQVARKYGDVGEELHGTDYLVFAYLQKGEDDNALAVIEDMPKAPVTGVKQFSGTYAQAAIPARYAVERRQWKEAARLPEPTGFPGGRYAWANAAIHFARALGAARSGDPEQAAVDVEALGACIETLERHDETYWATQVEIQRRAAAAWLALAEGREDEALESMRSAAELEGTTDKHPVTPGQIVPARELLAQMLLELGRPEEALTEFEAVLKAEPNRFGPLSGAARAAELAGRPDTARARFTQLVAVAPDSRRQEVREARDYLSRSVASKTGVN